MALSYGFEPPDSTFMKRVLISVLRALIFSGLVGAASAQTLYYWTGFGTGWQGQVTPPNNGTADLYLSDAINRTVTLPVDFSLDAIIFDTGNSGDTFKIQSTLPSTILINTGIISTGLGYGRLEFGSNINFAKNGPLLFDAGNSTIIIPGQIGGSTALDLLSSVAGTAGAFVFNSNSAGAGNIYSGGTTISAVAGNLVAVAFWNNSPFGTGNVDVLSSAQLVAHNTLTVANPLNFGTATANDPIYFKSWDGPLTLSGPVTLSNNTTLLAQAAQNGVPAPDNTGTYPTPGPPSRNPIVFTGTIAESGSHSLTVGGVGVVILQPSAGSNTYTGGTTVNGSLIFGNNNAIPAGASNVMVNTSGYVGFGNITAGNFATQLAHLNLTSAGAVGVDTLPGNSTVIFSDPINLSSFTSPSIRIGTATSAILTGAITMPAAVPDYHFGNGGGTLFVQSNLPNISTVSQLQLTDATNNGLVFPLELYLQGNDTYTGGTVANNGFIIFDAANSIPASGQLTAVGGSTANGASYIGYTDAVTAMTPATFLSKFNLANTWGIIGFDTHAANPTAGFSGVNLTGFNNGVYLGTATRANVSGTITPTADNILRLTAANGGTLTVNSNITGGTAVVVGSPSNDYHYSDGTVVLSPATANTYTGGTTFNNLGPLTLMVGGTTPLGTGPLTISNLNGGNTIGLQATTSNYTLANNIVFQNSVPGSFFYLYLTGANPLILAGNISGPGELDVVNSTATLSANNNNGVVAPPYTGDISLLNGTLNLTHNNAAGTGTLYFNGLNTDSVTFSGAATAPVLYGIKGDTGSLILPTGTVLTFDVSNQNNSTEFGGSIGGGPPVNASVVVTATTGGNGLYLFGSSNYTGGTTITNFGALGIGSNSALGTGAVTLNSSTAILALNQGVTLTNALNYSGGTLQGVGTFAPSNLTSITFGSIKGVIPGLFQVGDQNLTGTLTLGTDVVFADGGTFGWSLQDVSRGDGRSLLNITGNLDLTSISTNGFTLAVITIDALGGLGFANLTIGTPYTFAILQTGGTISGFSPTKFTINPTLFEGSQMPASVFSLTADANHLYLNFTAIPEPSTWLLLGTGAGMLGLAALRRRHRAARSVH